MSHHTRTNARHSRTFPVAFSLIVHATVTPTLDFSWLGHDENESNKQKG